tara:strand:+ start:657 stop:758 length:102 start_codon:yes stop_codon:yes gene_type:complete
MGVIELLMAMIETAIGGGGVIFRASIKYFFIFV